MVRESEWRIEFYEDRRGRSPVTEFILSVDLSTAAQLRRAIDRLRQQNLRAREPLVRHLEGHLWELRTGNRGNIYRIVYFFFTGRRIVFLHAFEKKTQRTPRGDLEIARQRYDDYVIRFGGRQQ